MIGSKGQRRGDREEEMVRLAQQGRIEIILDHKQPVELNNLFLLQVQEPLVVLPPPSPYPRVLLIEGPPGGGKSTYALHICHLWAQYASFLDRFEVVVLVYLRDLAIQNAATLADILPAHDCTQTVAAQIKASNGFNVLFIFDGWDEFPPPLQRESLISTIIRQPWELSLHQSTVLITSRPVSSGNLLHIADRRVEILGFTQHQIREYIEKALDGNSTLIQTLVQHLEEHPVIEGYCYVPLHVAILVHIFLTMKGTLPTTLHELFCNLVLCCIVRELETHQIETDVSAVSSLHDLPDDLKSKLSDLCVLAYKGVIQDKVVFYQDDIRRFKLPTNLSSLGLLQGVEGLTLLSKSLSYNFLHLSVQELLAAYHISQMDSSTQIEVFKHMFGSSRFQAVLHYYSGFTKLANPAIQHFILITSQQIKFSDSLPFLHCFFEAQNLSLCRLIQSEFIRDTVEIDFHLNPVDCLVVGYFITFLLSESSCDATNIFLKIKKSKFDCRKFKFLLLELIKLSEKRVSSSGFGWARRLEIEFNDMTITKEAAELIMSCLKKLPLWSKLITQDCKISEDGLLHITEELQKTCYSNLTELQFVLTLEACYRRKTQIGVNFQKLLEVNKSLKFLSLSTMDSFYLDFYYDIFKGLEYNSTLFHLKLSNASFDATAGAALGTMLQINKALTHLDLSGSLVFVLGDCGIFQALQHNTTLLHLNLSDTVGVLATEDIAQALSTMLRVNETLTHLDLSENRYFLTSRQGVNCMCEGLRHNTTLRYLKLENSGLNERAKSQNFQAKNCNLTVHDDQGTKHTFHV